MASQFLKTRIVEAGTLCAECFNKGRGEGKNLVVKRPSKDVFCVRCARTVRKGFEVNELIPVEMPEVR